MFLEHKNCISIKTYCRHTPIFYIFAYISMKHVLSLHECNLICPKSIKYSLKCFVFRFRLCNIHQNLLKRKICYVSILLRQEIIRYSLAGLIQQIMLTEVSNSCPHVYGRNESSNFKTTQLLRFISLRKSKPTPVSINGYMSM